MDFGRGWRAPTAIGIELPFGWILDFGATDQMNFRAIGLGGWILGAGGAPLRRSELNYHLDEFWDDRVGRMDFRARVARPYVRVLLPFGWIVGVQLIGRPASWIIFDVILDYLMGWFIANHIFIIIPLPDPNTR